MSTIDKINEAANRRQALWLKSCKPGGLDWMEQAELETINATLPILWDARRRELVHYRWML